MVACRLKSCLIIMIAVKAVKAMMTITYDSNKVDSDALLLMPVLEVEYNFGTFAPDGKIGIG
eukprot:scaffold44943_cov78-Cyclotella_meneghiniana.AAC.2